MLLNSKDECIKFLIDGCSFDGELLISRALAQVDPEGRLTSDNLKFNPVRVVTANDYTYGLDCLKRVDKIYEEFKKECYLSEYPENNIILNSLFVTGLNNIKIDVVLMFESRYFNNISLAKSILPKEILKVIEDHIEDPRIDLYRFFSWYDGNIELKDIDSKEDRFNLGDVTPVCKKLISILSDSIEEDGEIFRYKGDYLGKLSRPALMFISWFDLFVKEMPEDELVVKYRERVSKLPIRKLDLALILHTYDIKKYMGSYLVDHFIDSYMDMPMTELINLFWKRSDELKEVFRGAAEIPTHLMNIFWGILETVEE